MSIAGMEAVGARSPDFAHWAEQLEAMRSADGSFGQHPGKAFVTGGVAAAILRMGMNVEKREAVVATIKAGQRPDGAWSKDDGPSDLSSSYRVMRALYMLKEKPDAERLTGYVARCRHPDGSYSTTPEGPGNLGATYFATIILRWLRLLDGKPPLLRTAAFAPLFDKMDLDGWEGSSCSGRPGIGCWWASRLALITTSSWPPGNPTAISSCRFVSTWLTATVTAVSSSAACRIPGTEMSGYQADLGESYWGCLYDESRRNKVLVKASSEALSTLKKDDWNQYVLCAVGDRITLYLNGVASVVYREEVSRTSPETG